MLPECVKERSNRVEVPSGLVLTDWCDFPIAGPPVNSRPGDVRTGNFDSAGNLGEGDGVVDRFVCTVVDDLCGEVGFSAFLAAGEGVADFPDDGSAALAVPVEAVVWSVVDCVPEVAEGGGDVFVEEAGLGVGLDEGEGHCEVGGGFYVVEGCVGVGGVDDVGPGGDGGGECGGGFEGVEVDGWGGFAAGCVGVVVEGCGLFVDGGLCCVEGVWCVVEGLVEGVCAVVAEGDAVCGGGVAGLAVHVWVFRA